MVVTEFWLTGFWVYGWGKFSASLNLLYKTFAHKAITTLAIKLNIPGTNNAAQSWEGSPFISFKSQISIIPPIRTKRKVKMHNNIIARQIYFPRYYILKLFF